MNRSEDLELIKRIADGNDNAYQELVRKYQSQIIQLCTSMLSDTEEAKDAAQDAFVKAFYALDRFKGNSSFYTWLYRIASNHCLDILRKRSRQRTQSWEELIESNGEKIEQLFSTDPSKSHAREDQEIVNRVLSYLSPDYRLILTLREIQGLSYEEMAETLKCSIDSVKGRLKRARLDFKTRLQHFLGRESV